MAFDGLPRASQPIPEEPTPWWEWATRIAGGVMFIGVYGAWLVYTLTPAIRVLLGHAP